MKNENMKNGMTSIDRLIEAIDGTGNPTALGLDTRIEYLPPSLLRSASEEKSAGSTKEVCDAIRGFNYAMIDALADIVPCVKVQVACYEMLGVPGMELFRDTLVRAQQKGMITIADVKRNDIGSTAEAYAAAYLAGETAPFPADFATVNPYLGTDGVAPFLEACRKHGGGIFVLVRTSNPSAGEFQDLSTEAEKDEKAENDEKRPLYERVGLQVGRWGEDLTGRQGYSSVGAVVGATWPEESKKLRTLLPRTFFLVPGYGAQGATAKDLAGCFDASGRGAVVNASRSLLCAYKKRGTEDFASAARDEALRMREDLRGAIREKQ